MPRRAHNSPQSGSNDHTVSLRHGKKLKCVCAATLVYDVAPYPAVNDTVFEMVLLDQADQARAAASSRGWLSRAWGGVKGYVQSQVVAQRQASFAHHFSRQLEMNAEESHTVMMSARCAVLSMGQPQCGMLFATNYGLYFCADGVAMIESAVVEPEVHQDWDDVSTGSSVETRVVDEVLLEGREFIKDRVALSEVASILPSVALSTRGADDAPYIQGIPSMVVYPTALQLFVAGDAHQLFQFFGFSEIVVKPPGVAFSNKSSTAKTEAPAPVDEVVRNSELELLANLPSHLVGLQFISLLERLWQKRLERLGLPLLNPTITYAAPH